MPTTLLGASRLVWVRCTHILGGVSRPKLGCEGDPDSRLTDPYLYLYGQRCSSPFLMLFEANNSQRRGSCRPWAALDFGELPRESGKEPPPAAVLVTETTSASPSAPAHQSPGNNPKVKREPPPQTDSSNWIPLGCCCPWRFGNALETAWADSEMMWAAALPAHPGINPNVPAHPGINPKGSKA